MSDAWPGAPRQAAPVCANCGAPLVGPYCAQCGQKAAHRIVSLRHILEDALEDQLSLNAALPRTLRVLARQPGRLTREYVAGRVVSYIPPMRLYLIASVLFFLVMAVVPDTTEFTIQVPTRPAPAGVASTPASASVMLRIYSTGVTGWRRRLLSRFGEQIAKVGAMKKRDASRLLTEKFADAAPKVLFVLVPVFALLLKLLYVRCDRLYVEHFVFALHVHALAFLAFIPVLLANSLVAHAPAAYAPAASIAKALLFVGLAVYVFVAMRVVYEQGWGRTLMKWAVLGFCYLNVIAVAMAAGMAIALFQI